MRQLCRLCREPAEEGSIFCSQHRAAAARFSAAFNPDAPGAAAMLPTTAGPVATTPTTPAAPAAPITPAAVAAQSATAEELARVLAPVWDEIRGRAEKADPRDQKLRPVLCLYRINERLRARAFWAIVPASAGPTVALPLTAAALASALAPGGELFAILARELDAASAAFAAGTVQSLDVHVVTYAGLVLVTCHHADGKSERRALLGLCEGVLAPVSPESVAAALEHERW